MAVALNKKYSEKYPLTCLFTARHMIIVLNFLKILSTLATHPSFCHDLSFMCCRVFELVVNLVGYQPWIVYNSTLPTTHCTTPLVEGKWGFWDIDLGNFRKLGQDFLNLNFAEKPKIKEKNINFLQKIKIKNLSFFKKKLGQEIKNRKNPHKTGKIRKSFLGH